MSLEQAIHEHWADSAALESALPANRLTTGRTRSGTPPYATVQPRTIRSRLPTNQGPAVEEVAFRINVWHDDYDDARSIVAQIKEAFDGVTLDIDASARMARVRHGADAIKQHGDGLWQWTVDFTAKVYLLP